MTDSLAMLVTRWLQEDSTDREELLKADALITYLKKRLFDDYEPTPFDFFDARLERWIANSDDETEKRLLYRMLAEIFFVGRLEFLSLCRAALNGPVTRWLIDECDIDVTGAEAADAVSTALESVWFCPITDSMRINAFLKVNNLEGHEHRPDWSSMAAFGDGSRIASYIEKNRIRRLVLLEDFVGSGTQMKKAIHYACKHAGLDIPILACPLLICPKGVETGIQLSKEYPRLRFDPVLSLHQDVLVHPEPQPGEASIHGEIRALVAKISAAFKVKRGPATHGFKGTGALVVLYSNCPNNTLPIVHEQAKDWNPIFPRVTRR